MNLPLRKRHCPASFPANESVKFKVEGITVYIYWKSSGSTFSAWSLPGATQKAVSAPVALVLLLSFSVAHAVSWDYIQTFLKRKPQSRTSSTVFRSFGWLVACLVGFFVCVCGRACVWFQHLLQHINMTEQRGGS